MDEKKELVEFSNTYLRLFLGLIAFLINGGIFVAVLYFFIKDAYYNEENLYIWVLSFFGAQFFGLCITAPSCLLILAAIVSKWFKFNKVMLARCFRDGLYIYEDYKFVVKFAKTKIS